MSDRHAFRRVTVVLDPASYGAELLTTAAEVAGRLRVEVQGLMLQDVNLHRLAELGIARLVSRFAAAEPPGSIGALLERLAGQAQVSLGETARELGIPWSFQILCSDSAAELPPAIGEGELLVVNVDDGWPRRGLRFGGEVWRASEARAASILVVRRPLRRLAPVVLVIEPSVAAERSLMLDADLLPSDRHQGQRLDVVLAGTGKATAAAATWLRERYRANITAIPDYSIDTMMRAVRGIGGNLLLIPADAPFLHQPEHTFGQLDAADCAILLLR